MAGRERVCATMVMLLPPLLLLTLVDVAFAVPESCTAVHNVYRRLKFRDPVPSEPISGEHLKMCSGEMTCCTDVMESKLSVESRQEFDTQLKRILNPMAALLAKKNTKLNEVFGKLLNHSKANFHEMFSKTYGILYQQNSDVFTKLYEELEKYFKTGELDLQETMDNFFRQLYERMFTVMNGQYTFTSRYLKCVSRHMDQLQPFRDVPEKLTIQIKRSFVALRTFVQGLATGRDVVRNVLKVNPGINCVHELMRMSHCATCAGQLRTQPCQPYCSDVINLCLAHHRPLISHWTAYVDAMVSVGERLENPFNIENVVEPVNYKISDAIMNFQESGMEISEKVFKGCGSPRLGRSKRHAGVAEGELSQEFLDFRGSEREDRRREREQESISVSRHVHEIKTKIRNARMFWSELPSKMCHETASDSATNCWTGSKVGKYEPKGGFNVTEPPHSSAMDEQVMRLKVITSKLHEAFKGRDVSWIDDESWLGGNGGRQGEQADTDVNVGHGQEEGSGSGDGDGSGSIGHLPPDDEDAYAPRNKHYDPYGNFDDDEDMYSSNTHGSGHDEGYDRAYEDNYEGSGWSNIGGDSEGSGDDYVVRSRGPVHSAIPESRPPQRPPSHGDPKADPEQPPSAAAKETMSLNRAITIYMLPAIIMFLGSLA